NRRAAAEKTEPDLLVIADRKREQRKPARAAERARRRPDGKRQRRDDEDRAVRGDRGRDADAELGKQPRPHQKERRRIRANVDAEETGKARGGIVAVNQRAGQARHPVRVVKRQIARDEQRRELRGETESEDEIETETIEKAPHHFWGRTAAPTPYTPMPTSR